MVRTAAVPADAPEVLAAAARGIPVFSRGAVLPALLEGRTSVAVGGTHGKTTTTTFITEMLQFCGRDPSWCIGGEVDALGGVAGEGQGGCLVVEADESDGTLALYRPDVAVITNIEFDHMEHFASVADFEECFRRFAAQAKRRVVYCADDPRAASVCAPFSNAASYGFAPGARFQAVDAHESADGQRFGVNADGVPQGEVVIPVPGRHNVLNALAALAVGLEMGLSFDEIRAALGRVTLPRRRFERIAERDGILVMSDYAHHPTEIAAFLRAAQRLPHRRLLAVFQPHRYTRTLALARDFAAAFDGVDELVLAPVYAASEPPLKGGTTWDLYREFRRQGAGVRGQVSGVRCQGAGGKVLTAASLEQAWEYYRRKLRAGDVLLVIGAGDVEKIAGWAKEALEQGRLSALPDLPPLSAATAVRRDEPLARKTTLKVGGCADVWAEVGAVEDLAALRRWAGQTGIALHVLGGGSNVLVSDLGVRGVVARLTGEAFRGVREENGVVVAGAGLSLAALLDWAEKHSLEGLEFLEGIPGTVGGAARMNAGAWGHALAERVAWIRCLNADGAEHIVPASDLGAGYRRCDALASRTAVEVGFALRGGRRAEIRRRRAETAGRRAWMRGMRSAGSVFKNPAGDFAGRLIEVAGLKGARVGGAFVSALHANVIAAEEGARASDVRALLEQVRAEVQARFGVRLETEMVFLE